MQIFSLMGHTSLFNLHCIELTTYLKKFKWQRVESCLSEDLLTVLHCFISRAIDGLHLLLKQLHISLCPGLCWIVCLLRLSSLCLSVLSASADTVYCSLCSSTEITDTLLISAAEHLHHFTVTRADVLLELLRGLHQLVLLKWR